MTWKVENPFSCKAKPDRSKDMDMALLSLLYSIIELDGFERGLTSNRIECCRHNVRFDVMVQSFKIVTHALFKKTEVSFTCIIIPGGQKARSPGKQCMKIEAASISLHMLVEMVCSWNVVIITLASRFIKIC